MQPLRTHKTKTKPKPKERSSLNNGDSHTHILRASTPTFMVLTSVGQVSAFEHTRWYWF